MDTTVVTAFFPIRSKFPEDTYMKWAARFMRMRSPIVLYTPKHLISVFTSLRKDYGPLTTYATELEDIHTWILYADRWRSHHLKDRESAYHTPELYAVWANKPFFVSDTVKKNPYKTTHFYWCDIGAFRQHDPHPNFPMLSYRLTTLPHDDRILMNSVNPLTLPQDLHISEDGIVGNFEHVDQIVGGLWGGSASSCLRFCSAFEAQLLRYFSANRFAGKDQTVYMSAVLEDPTLAYILDPVPTHSNDRWFFQHALLSNPLIPSHLDATYPTDVSLPLTTHRVTVNLMGGLGNQMFQVAAAFAHALKHRSRLMLDIQKEVQDSRPTMYWDSVLHRFRHFLSPSIGCVKERSIHWYEKESTVYSKLPELHAHNLYLRGYFQSPRYFTEIHSLIRDMFRPSASLIQHIRTSYNHLLDSEMRERVVVVHARRGDYMAAADYHGPLPYSYYVQAMLEIQTRHGHSNTPLHYLLVGDDPLFWVDALPHLPLGRKDSTYHTFEILSPTDVNEVECLALLQQFRQFILANSTYSWWAAFLAGPETTVIAPAQWFGPKGPSSWEDIYMPDWIRV